ncbi:MAG TPA: hypothetical protein EYG88_12710 [Desulfocapsa sulfexigens]|nr:hypothetical protein [Desulfocapsa sulfexigens]
MDWILNTKCNKHPQGTYMPLCGVSYKDRQNNMTKTMPFDAMEFICRFLLHVLPGRFMKIRYYGFLGSICRKKSVLLIRRLMSKAMKLERFINETLQEKVFRLTGKDIFLCPHCRNGQMLYQGILQPVTQAEPALLFTFN